MKLAVLSDIHDQLKNLQKALKQIHKESIDYAIFCGDYCSPGTFIKATRDFGKAYCVWGNADEDKLEITQKIYLKNIKNVVLLGQLVEVNIQGRKIAIVHYNNKGERLAKSGHYDAVFHGHSHVAKNEKVRNTLIVNPGPICGYKNGKQVPASFAIYETINNCTKIVKIL